MCKEGCELVKERVGFDCFVCLAMLWLAEEESCGGNNGVIRPLLRQYVTCALRTLTHNYGRPSEWLEWRICTLVQFPSLSTSLSSFKTVAWGQVFLLNHGQIETLIQNHAHYFFTVWAVEDAL